MRVNIAFRDRDTVVGTFRGGPADGYVATLPPGEFFMRHVTWYTPIGGPVDITNGLPEIQRVRFTYQVTRVRAMMHASRGMVFMVDLAPAAATTDLHGHDILDAMLHAYERTTGRRV